MPQARLAFLRCACLCGSLPCVGRDCDFEGAAGCSLSASRSLISSHHRRAKSTKECHPEKGLPMFPPQASMGHWGAQPEADGAAAICRAGAAALLWIDEVKRQDVSVLDRDEAKGAGSFLSPSSPNATPIRRRPPPLTSSPHLHSPLHSNTGRGGSRPGLERKEGRRSGGGIPRLPPIDPSSRQQQRHAVLVEQSTNTTTHPPAPCRRRRGGG